MNPDTILALRSDVRHTRVGEEGVVLRQDDAEILVVNDSAARFIELIDGSTSIDQLAQALLGEYDTDKATLLADLLEFSRELAAIGALETQ